jgi:DNA gyrase subunit B
LSPATKTPQNYEASDFQVLEGLEPVRLRPGMYIGSNDSAGLQHCLWEILDNSVDEALAGHCKHIEITLYPDTSVEVSDDGRGIPVDIEPKTQMSALRVVFEKLHAGGKFGSENYAVAGGLHGVGAAVVNAVSRRLEVSVKRDGLEHALSFSRGVPGTFDKDENFIPDLSTNPTPRLVGKVAKTLHGTTVRYWYDPQIFTADADIDIEAIRDRVKTTTYIIPGLTITLNDQRTLGIDPEIYHSTSGLKGYIKEKATAPEIAPILEFEGQDTFSQFVLGNQVERNVSIYGVLRWDSGYDSNFRGFVNVIATPEGGTHILGVERALLKLFNDAYKETRILKSNITAVTKEDIYEGLSGAVYVKLPEPLFKGQTKGELATAEVRDITYQAVMSSLGPIFKDTRPRAKVRPILEKVAQAALTRVTAKLQRETIRRKNALESSSMPAKLADCLSNNIEENEIFIVEGDSAMGTARKARRAKIQALLPIRGKILNTLRASEKQMLDNAECASIITAIGAGSGRSFNLENRRYGKLIIMADADVDGSHIRILLLTLCWKYMRPLLEEGHVYAAVPPLYSIEVNRAAQPIFAYSDEERDNILKNLAKSKKTVKGISRFKGLGEMSAEELADTTMDPDNRQLRRILVSDAELAFKQFNSLMGDDPAERRAFIAERSAALKLEDLDI